MVWPIATKFGTMTRWPFWPMWMLKFQKLEIHDGGDYHIKKSKNRHMCNGLTNRHDIWHSDAVWPSWPLRQLRIRKFKNPTWQWMPSWKITISPQRFDQSPRNLARWHSLTLLTLLTVKISKIGVRVRNCLRLQLVKPGSLCWALPCISTWQCIITCKIFTETKLLYRK